MSEVFNDFKKSELWVDYSKYKHLHTARPIVREAFSFAHRRVTQYLNKCIKEFDEDTRNRFLLGDYTEEELANLQKEVEIYFLEELAYFYAKRIIMSEADLVISFFKEEFLIALKNRQQNGRTK